MKIKGKFIVFEGIEGSGKTSQIKQLQEWLQDGGLGKPINVLTTREPGGTNLGKKLRSLLLEGEEIASRSELLLYAADRAEHVNQFLKPHLEKGTTILCDRFTDSTIAYQGYGRGLDLDLIQQLNTIASDGLEIDFTFWLDVKVETGLNRIQQRGKRDRIEKLNIDFHERVKKGYNELANKFCHRITKIDSNQEESHVQAEIRSVLLAQWQNNN